MKNLLIKLIIIFIPPLIMAYFLFVNPLNNELKKECPKNYKQTFLLGYCELNFGEALKRNGISPIVSGVLPDCEDIEKGHCITKKHRLEAEAQKEMIKIDNYEYMMVTSTIKGFDPLKELLK